MKYRYVRKNTFRYSESDSKQAEKKINDEMGEINSTSLRTKISTKKRMELY